MHEKNNKLFLKHLCLHKCNKMCIKKKCQVTFAFFWPCTYKQSLLFLWSERRIEIQIEKTKKLRGRYREGPHGALLAFSCTWGYILYISLWMHPLNGMLFLYSVAQKNYLYPDCKVMSRFERRDRDRLSTFLQALEFILCHTCKLFFPC